MSQKPDYEFVGHQSYVIDLLFAADSKHFVTSGMDNVIKLWSTDQWEMLAEVEAHQNSVNSISISPSGDLLLSGSSDQTVALWTFPEISLKQRLQDRKKVVSTVTFSPDGQWIAAGSYGGRVMIWTIDGQEILGITASKKNLTGVTFSPDQALLATAGLGDDIAIWSLPSGEKLRTLSGHETAVINLRFIQNGEQLLSLGYEQTIRFWETKSWKPLQHRRAAREKTRGFALSTDEKILAEVSVGKVVLTDLETGDEIREVPVGTNAVYGVAFSPDGDWMAVGAADGKIRFWRLPRLLEGKV